MAFIDGSKSVYESSDDGSTFMCSPCNYEGVKKEAKFYCPQCQDYLCDSCKSAHQKMSASRNHKVVAGSAMPRKLENKSNEGIKARSSAHVVGNILKFTARIIMKLCALTAKH